MDSHRFDAITRVAANAPDRRNVLKLLGGAVAAGLAGIVARPDEAEAALVNIIITDVLNNVLVNVEVKNNNVAVQICAVVELLDDALGTDLTCTINQ